MKRNSHLTFQKSLKTSDFLSFTLQISSEESNVKHNLTHKA